MQAQPAMRPVHDLAVAVDDVPSVMERVLGVECKELVLDRHRRIASRRNVARVTQRIGFAEIRTTSTAFMQQRRITAVAMRPSERPTPDILRPH